jgi:hypothetical protein
MLYLLLDILPWVRRSSSLEGVERGGRATKSWDLLQLIQENTYTCSHTHGGTSSSNARSVDPSRVSLPQKAGGVDPCDWLKERELETFKDS